MAPQKDLMSSNFLPSANEVWIDTPLSRQDTPTLGRLQGRQKSL